MEKGALLGLIAVGLNTLYELVGFFGGDHWPLEEDETVIYAKCVDKALDTLPGEYYAILRKIIEKQFPWITLAVVAGKITVPRIQETRRKYAQPDQAGGAAQTQAAPGGSGTKQNGAGNQQWNHYRAEPAFR